MHEDHLKCIDFKVDLLDKKIHSLFNLINKTIGGDVKQDEFDALKSEVGKLDKLKTTDKSSTVNAINELYLKPQIEIVDNLTTEASNKALSAKQGKVLNTTIGDLEELTTENKNSTVEAINEINSKKLEAKIVDNLNNVSKEDVLSARQGSVLNSKLSSKEDKIVYISSRSTYNDVATAYVQGRTIVKKDYVRYDDGGYAYSLAPLISYTNGNFVFKRDYEEGSGFELHIIKQNSPWMMKIIQEVDILEFWNLLRDIGDLDNLNTEDKTNIVNAINEVFAEAKTKLSIDVIDNLESDSTTDALSARQGKILNESVVHKEGDETITGAKEFTNQVTLQRLTVNAINSPTARVDIASAIGFDDANDISLSILSSRSDGTTRLTGIASPKFNEDAANKKYVDDSVSAKYAKPSKGIPATDLAEDVQQNLAKAAEIYDDYVSASNLI